MPLDFLIFRLPLYLACLSLLAGGSAVSAMIFWNKTGDVVREDAEVNAVTGAATIEVLVVLVCWSDARHYWRRFLLTGIRSTLRSQS